MQLSSKLNRGKKGQALQKSKQQKNVYLSLKSKERKAIHSEFCMNKIKTGKNICMLISGLNFEYG